MTKEIAAPEAECIVEKVMDGLIKAGVKDEATLSMRTVNILKQHEPEVLKALANSALEQECASVLDEFVKEGKLRKGEGDVYYPVT